MNSPQFATQYYDFHDILSLDLYRKDRMMDNIVGKKFGEWTIIESAGRDEKSEQLYVCKCSCGLIRIHRRSILTKGKSIQCKKCCMIAHNSREILTGQTFGLWIVGERVKNEARNEWVYKCICECGTEKLIPGHSLKNGRSKKCPHCRVKTHGMSYTDTFRIWQGLFQRCQNPKCKAYKYYGGRGIKIADKWKTFEGFYEDMGNRPSNLQLDRINNDGNYEPGNCRWVTCKVNNSNRINKRKRKGN